MFRPGWSQDRPDLKKKKIYIYNNLKFFICLPFKKKFENTFKFSFFINKIKFCSIICSTFKQKEKAKKRFLELKSEKGNCNIVSPTDPKKKGQHQS